MKTHFSTLVALALALSLLSPLRVAAQDQPTEPAAQPTVTEEMGYGFGSAVANILYIPAKVVYAGLGLMTGGLGYVLSGGRGDVANNIIYPAVRGTYVVTPGHLRGEQPVIFVGASPEEPRDEQLSMSGAPNPQP
jgi:hypothetical protein